MESHELYKLWRSLKTTIEMIGDRGYKIDEDLPTLEEFIEMHDDTSIEEVKKQMTTIFKKEKVGPIAAFWKNSLGNNDIQEIYESMKQMDVKKAVVIYVNKITPTAATALRHLRVQKIIIDSFSEAEMQYNVSRHEEVPRHIICTAAKKAKILEDYSVTVEQLPQIKTTDPQVRYWGAVKGQLIKIMRKSDSIPEVSVPCFQPTYEIEEENKVLYDVSYRYVS